MSLLEKFAARAKSYDGNPRQEMSPSDKEAQRQNVNLDEETGIDTSNIVSADTASEDEIRLQEGAQRKAEFSQVENAPQDSRAFTGWGNDFTTMSLGEKNERSLMKGLATVAEMPGDLIELATAYTGVLKPLSDWFYEQAAEIRSDNVVLKSVELEEFDWGDLGSLEFWTTNAAEQIPYMAALIGSSFAGGAGMANLSTKIASKMIKRGVMRGSSKTMATFNIGKKVAKLDMDVMRNIAQVVGGGFTQNTLVGAGAAHQAKEEALAAGLTEEQAYDVAANTFLDNAKYVAVDMASYYATFKLGGVMGRSMNKSMDNIQAMSKGVGRSLARASVNIAKVGTGTSIEAIEESFQEVYEEWIVKKNVAEAQGQDFQGYWEFYNSPEMLETKVTAAALGALFGGAGNIVGNIAERKAYLDTKTRAAQENKNIEEYTEDQKRLKIERTISESVVNEENQNLGLFWADMENRGEITTEQVEDYATITQEFEESYKAAIESSRTIEGGINESGARVLQNIFVHKRHIKRERETLNTNFNESYKIKKEAGATAETLKKMQSVFQAQDKVLQDQETTLEQNRKDLVSGKIAKIKLKSGMKMNPATGEITIDPKIAKEMGLAKNEKITLEDAQGLSQSEFDNFRIEGNSKVETFFDKVKNKFTQLGNLRRKKKGETEADTSVNPSEFSKFGNYQAAQTENGNIEFVDTVNGEKIGSEKPLQYNAEKNEFTSDGEVITEAEALTSLRKEVGDREAVSMMKEITDNEAAKKDNDETIESKEGEFSEALAAKIEEKSSQIEFLDDNDVESIVRAMASEIESSLSLQNKAVLVSKILEKIKNGEYKSAEEIEAEKAIEAEKKLSPEETIIAERNLAIFTNLQTKRFRFYQNSSAEISQALHMNSMLKKNFPKINNGQGINAVLLSRMHDFFGGPQNTALALGSTIYLTPGFSKRTEFFEEMGHIVYALYGETPFVKEYVDRLLKKKAYIANIKKDYADQLLNTIIPNETELDGKEYFVKNGKVYYSTSGVEYTGPYFDQILSQATEPDTATLADFKFSFGEELNSWEAVQKKFPNLSIEELPIEQQEIIKDEAFAKSLVFTTQNKYSIYFNDSDANLSKNLVKRVSPEVKKLFGSRQEAANFAGVLDKDFTPEMVLGLLQQAKETEAEVNVNGRASKSNSRKAIKEQGQQLAIQFNSLNTSADARAEQKALLQRLSGEDAEGDSSIESMDLDKKNKFGNSNRALMGMFIRDNNYEIDKEVITQPELWGQLGTMAHSVEVSNGWEFVAAMQQNSNPVVQKFLAYVNEKIGKYGMNTLQGLYLESKSLVNVPIVQTYVNSEGGIKLQQSLSPSEIKAHKVFSKSFAENANLPVSSNNENLGVIDKKIFAAKNRVINEAVAFAFEAAPTVEKANEIFAKLMPKLASVSDSLNLSFMGEPILYNGQYLDPIEAFKLAIKRSLIKADLKGNYNFVDGKFDYKLKGFEFDQFLRGYLNGHRAINGETVSADVNGNYTTSLIKGNTLLNKATKIHTEWKRHKLGMDNTLHNMLGISKEILANPETIQDAFIKHVVLNGMQVSQYGGIAKTNKGYLESATFSEMDKETLLINNFILFSQDYKTDKKKTAGSGYHQMINVHGNSSTNYVAFVPYTSYAIEQNGSAVRSTEKSAVKTKENALKYYNDPNAESIINEIVKENYKVYKKLLEEMPEKIKNGYGFKNLMANGKLTTYGKVMIQNYVENHIYNQIMLHKGLYGESQEFGINEEFDYTKKTARQKGMVTPGTQLVENGNMEVMSINMPTVNIDGKEVNVTDGDMFILPEQLDMLRIEHGMNGLISQNLKLIADTEYTDQNGKSNHLQLKSMTFVLTEEFARQNPHMKAIKKAMEIRYAENKNLHNNYIIFAAPLDAVKSGKSIKENAHVFTSNDIELEVTGLLNSMNNSFGASGQNVPISADSVRIVQNSDIEKKSTAIPIQFIAALYSHAQPGSTKKAKIDKIQKTFNEYRNKRLDNLLKGIKGLDKKSITEISKKLNEIIDQSEASELDKSLSFLNNINMPQMAQGRLDLLARQFVNEGIKARQNGTMGLHVTEYSQYKIDGNGKPLSQDNDALKPPTIKNGKIVPGEILLPAHMFGKVQKDDVVLVSRVPAHGLQTTVPMKVAGFSKSDNGNRVQTNSVYADIMGGDHDGDHLYINAKDKKQVIEYNNWFDDVVTFLTDADIYEDATASINVDQIALDVLGENIKKEENSFFKQFSPIHQAEVFQENMNSAIGIVASTNRLGFLLRAENVKLRNSITISGKSYNGFANSATDSGYESVAYQAQQLLQVVLDNPKKHYATAMNITNETVGMYSMLVNMGAPIKDVYEFFNNEGVEAYIQAGQKTKSMFREGGTLKDLETEATKILQEQLKGNRERYMKAIETLESIIAIQQMTEELFKINRLMGQHKKIYSDPALMSKVISDAEVILNDNGKYFTNTAGFAKNPEVNHYLEISKRFMETAKQVSILGSDFHSAAYEIASNSYMGANFENTSGYNTLKSNGQKLLSSMAVASNLESNAYYQSLPGQLAKKVMNLKSISPENTFLKMLNVYGEEIRLRYDMREKASLNKSLIDQVRKDFDKLSPEIQKDFVNYDLLTNGFNGPNSISSLFSETKLKQISSGIKNIMLDGSLQSNSSTQEDLVKKTIASVLMTGKLKTNKVFGSNMKAKGQNVVPNSETKSVDKLSFLQDLTGIENNQRFAITMTRSNKPDAYMLYQPMQKNIFAAFKSDKDQAITKADKWQVFKEYMNEMEFEFLADEYNGPKDAIERALILSSYQTNTRGGASVSQLKKKTSLGRASARPYYERDNKRALGYEEFLGQKNGLDNQPNKVKFGDYQKKFAQYAKMASQLSLEDLQNMSNKQIEKASLKAMRDSDLASGQYVEMLNREAANRMAVEQAKTTGILNLNPSRDINRAFLWLGSDNVSEQNPHLQSLYRTFEKEFTEWEQAANPEIEKINQVTNDLMAEKLAEFPWWKRILMKTISGRKLFEKLYENLIEWKVDVTGKQVYEEMKLIDAEKAKGLSKAEKAFYDVFTDMTGKYGDIAQEAGTLQKKREGYIPHIHSEWLEAMQTKGIAGLYFAGVPKNQKAKNVILEAYDPLSGKIVKQPFSYFENVYMGGNPKVKELLKLGKIRIKAEIYAAKGTNQDGSPLRLQEVESDALLGNSQFARFDKKRSMNAKMMPTMDLNHALNSYVRATIFRHGNKEIGGKFEGIERLMPLVDGVIRIKAGHGAKNAAELADKLFRQKKIMGKSQTSVLGKGGDFIVNKINQATIYAGLGFNVSAAAGNIIMGKYAILRNNGGKVFQVGEKRYWGFDKIDNKNWMPGMKKRQAFLSHVGLIDESFYYDYSVSQKNNLVSKLQQAALSPMTISENWIQGANLLGMLSEEEYQSINEDGTHNIDAEKLRKMLSDIRRTHGRGYTPSTERMIGLYSLGRSFQMFKKYLITNYNERFGPELTNMYGDKEIGSMREFGHVAKDLISGRMNNTTFKEYYKGLPDHKQESLMRAIRGIGLFTAIVLSMQMMDDDDEPESTTKKQAKRHLGRAYNDVMKYYDITQAKRLLTPYPYYTVQNAVGNMTNDISLTRDSNITIK